MAELNDLLYQFNSEITDYLFRNSSVCFVTNTLVLCSFALQIRPDSIIYACAFLPRLRTNLLQNLSRHSEIKVVLEYIVEKRLLLSDKSKKHSIHNLICLKHLEIIRLPLRWIPISSEIAALILGYLTLIFVENARNNCGYFYAFRL